MKKKYHIFNARIVNEDCLFIGEIFIDPPFITKINREFKSPTPNDYFPIDAEGLLLFPGIIDDQVHFREPGLTYKADIQSESMAAIAGGVTTFFDNPNTIPPTLSQELLEEKYILASQSSKANFSFFMGASNENIEEVLKTPIDTVCGIKMFLGASTGNLLVDNQNTIENLFRQTPHIVAVHCEDEKTIKTNSEKYFSIYGEKAPPSIHPLVRSEEACYLSSSSTIALAKKLGSNLHVYHVSTAIETELFDANVAVEEKKITAEVCIHHLWFTDNDYDRLGNLIKWNPSVKTEFDRTALRNALREGRIDIVATDHAPHTIEEKNKPYFSAPSGGPMVQHSLQAMLSMHAEGEFSLEQIARFMAHNPALRFKIDRRGFIREGYYADLVLINPHESVIVGSSNIHYKCAWSPLDKSELKGKIISTFVNGYLAYHKGQFSEYRAGMRLRFNR